MGSSVLSICVNFKSEVRAFILNVRLAVASASFSTTPLLLFTCNLEETLEDSVYVAVENGDYRVQHNVLHTRTERDTAPA